MQGYFSTVQRQGTVSGKQLSWSVVHLELPWSLWEGTNLGPWTPPKRGPFESTVFPLYLNRLKNGKGPHIVIFLILSSRKKIISKIYDTGQISMIAYISKRLNRRYLNKLRAGVLFAYIPKALFLYFTISWFFFFFSSVWIKIVAFPCFPVTFRIVTGFVRLHQSHLITLYHVKKQWKIRYVSTFLLKEAGFMVHRISYINIPIHINDRNKNIFVR